MCSTWWPLLLGAIAFIFLQLCSGSQPSKRSTLFLSTTRATWNEALQLCKLRSASLLKMTSDNVIKQLRVLDTSDEWSGTFQSLLAQGGYWLALYERNTTGYVWQDCEPMLYEGWAAAEPAVLPGRQCVYLGPDSLWHAAPCNQSLHYICQRNESECWFDPLEETIAVTPGSDNVTTDESACAAECRNALDAKGTECWGISFRSYDRTCRMHFHSDATAFTDRSLMASNLQQHSNWTFYSKVCLAGLIKPDNVTFSIPNPEPVTESCPEETNTTLIWEEDVCYCECENEPDVWDPTIDQAAYQSEFKKEVAALAVDSKNTSSSQRKLISVEDKRPSAQSIGYVGVIFLCLVFGGIVLLDMNVLVSHVQQLARRCRKSAGSRRLRSVSPATE